MVGVVIAVDVVICICVLVVFAVWVVVAVCVGFHYCEVSRCVCNTFDAVWVVCLCSFVGVCIL